MKLKEKKYFDYFENGLSITSYFGYSERFVTVADSFFQIFLSI